MPAKKQTTWYAALPLIACAALLNSGCYLLSQGSYLLQDRIAAQPIDRFLKKKSPSEKEEEFFSRVESVRTFAKTELDAVGSKNYTTYLRIERDYLAAVVSASEKYSFTPYRWKFPIVGSVPYKGFYNIEKAQKEAVSLQKQGYDVWVRRVDAFSTLGFFTDPLYSFMTEYPIHRIAELIIHEETHAVLWLKDKPQFNEEAAAFMGERGAEAYLKAEFGLHSEQLKRYLDEKHDREVWLEDIRKLRRDLESVYSAQLSSEELPSAKEQTVSEFKQQFSETYESRYRTELYTAVAELPINNAFISLYDTYYGHTELFETLFESCGRDLQVMLRSLKKLEKSSEDPYEGMKQMIEEFNLSD